MMRQKVLRAESAPWQASMQEAKALSAANQRVAARAISELDGDRRARAEQALNKLAAAGLSGAGIRTATAGLVAMLPSFADAGQRTSGEDKNIAAVKLGALAVLHGVVARAGEAIRSTAQPKGAAVELLRAVLALDLGRNTSVAALREEARAGLGPDLYFEALRVLDPSLPRPQP